jgi:hypothetical protein
MTRWRQSLLALACSAALASGTAAQTVNDAAVAAVAATKAAAAQASATAPAAAPDDIVTPPEHRRGIEQTFLTYPEWFLVFSPAEYARFLHDGGRPSDFPFMGHVGQFWSGYKAVFDEQRAQGYPLNPGYHLMILVIGTSTTVEYTLRSGYEGTVGRLSEALGGHDTPEDRYAAQVAQDYVDFIRVLPWYQYDFSGKLVGLWRGTPAFGPHMIRKWERRFALSTEYLVKAIYGQIIKGATGTIYDKPILVTAIVVRTAPQADPALPDVHVLRTLPDGRALITVPRYDAFTRYAQALAKQGVNFDEIAGNKTVMLVSLVGAADWRPATGVDKVLFEQPILTQPGRKRIVLTARVPELAETLREWSQEGVQVEHLFDY